MKVIFLDIDGVVNTSANKWETERIKFRGRKCIPTNREPLAREIGHLLLHIGTDIKENDLSVQKTFNFSIKEKDDAELFAFAFLMPKIEFRQKLLETRKENYADLETVAKYFNVTIGKARQRAYQLELLKTIV